MEYTMYAFNKTTGECAKYQIEPEEYDFSQNEELLCFKICLFGSSFTMVVFSDSVDKKPLLCDTANGQALVFFAKEKDLDFVRNCFEDYLTRQYKEEYSKQDAVLRKLSADWMNAMKCISGSFCENEIESDIEEER